MSTDQSNPYLFRGLLCAIAVIGLILAALLYPSVARYYFVKANRDKIFEAVALGTVEKVKYFIERGVSVNVKDPTGTPLIYWAARYNPDVNVMKYLIDNGADVNAKDIHGQTTPLHQVIIWSDNPGMAKILIDNGADVNAKDDLGRTPLHCVTGYSPSSPFFPPIKVLKYLIEKGADVNAKDNNGQTPLDYVSGNSGNDEMEAILREAGGKRGEELPE